MNVRTLEDLNLAIISNLHRIPEDTDLIVGIPRSGLLVANLIAGYLNLPLTDFDGFCQQRTFASGRTRQSVATRKQFKDYRTILILDDSVNSGITLQDIRETAASLDIKSRVIFGAAYVAPAAINLVDIYFEVVPPPRAFTWNLLHQYKLENMCVDIDGVICRDPTEDENDDGQEYIKFLNGVERKITPTKKIGTLVTCRLEKYRDLTENWLHEKGVVYDRLVMMDYENMEERRRKGEHSQFKAEHYQQLKADLFIESSYEQAVRIAALARRPVFCMQNQKVIRPSILLRLKLLFFASLKRFYYEQRWNIGRIIRRFNSEVTTKF